MNTPKRILITGSNGLLGQKLSDVYLAQNEVIWLATGKGANRHPQKEKMEITGLGRLKNTIVAEKSDFSILALKKK